jgi:tRNA-specific 2-thiouridylase
MGHHAGIYNFTVGQRCGSGIASGKRLYVTDIDSHCNEVIVGGVEELYRHTLEAVDLNWISGHPPENGTQVQAQIRYRAAAAVAELRVGRNIVTVKFHSPQKAISPGQSVVFYQGDEILGGGIIKAYAT